MVKSRFYAVGLIVCLALPAWGVPPEKNGLVIPSPSPTVSPSDFQSSVSTLGAENKKAVDQQVTASMPKAPPPLPKAQPSPPSPLSSPLPTSTDTRMEEETSQQEAYPASNPSPSARPRTNTPTTAPNYSSPAGSAQQRGQSYTGFVGSPGKGTGSAPQTTPAPASGGWNIKY